jgi:hypothetical protein
MAPRLVTPNLLTVGELPPAPRASEQSIAMNNHQHRVAARGFIFGK